MAELVFRVRRKKKAWVAPSFPQVAPESSQIAPEKSQADVLVASEDSTVLAEATESDLVEEFSEMEAVLNDSAPETSKEVTSDRVEEVEGQGQGYSTLNDFEDTLGESSEIILDDLPMDSLVDEGAKTLSIEEAKKIIPEAVLQVLKEKFNGSLENCRPIKDYDRLC